MELCFFLSSLARSFFPSFLPHISLLSQNSCRCINITSAFLPKCKGPLFGVPFICCLFYLLFVLFVVCFCCCLFYLLFVLFVVCFCLVWRTTFAYPHSRKHALFVTYQISNSLIVTYQKNYPLFVTYEISNSLFVTHQLTPYLLHIN